MIFTTRVKTPRFTKEELKAAGFDPRTKICPNHPNVVSVNGLRDIILVPYRTTKFDKTLGKDIIIAMGLSCGRCGMVIKSDIKKTAGHIVSLPDAGKTQEKGGALPYPTDETVGEGQNVPNLGNRGVQPVG